MEIKPLGENVLIKPDTIEEKTETGFVLPKNTEKITLFGVVFGVGSRCEKEIKKGQKVIYARYSGNEIGEYIIINQNDIIGICK